MAAEAGSPTPAVRDHHEVIVVGAGQAGLAIGYHLARQGRRFVILEAAAEPGAAWRARWESLRLFTPVRYDALPALPFPGDPDSYPGRDEVAHYLADYAAHFELPIELNSRVRSVRRGDGSYLVELGATEPTKPIRSSSLLARSSSRSCRRSRSASAPTSSSSTAATTGGRIRSHLDRYWWSVEATRAIRSPRSSHAHTRSISRSDRGRFRCLSAFSAVTCSGSSRQLA